jgi:hypothetical protein
MGFTGGIRWDGRRFWFRGAFGEMVEASSEAKEALSAFLDRFRAQFGRDPGPGDPIVFDPTKDAPAPMPIEEVEEGVREILIDMGLHPALRHARQTLGYLVTSENVVHTKTEDITRWNDCVRAWCEAHPQVPPPQVTIVSLEPAMLLKRIDQIKRAYPHGPEYAAAQETLAHACYLEDEARKLVIAIVMMQGAPKPAMRLYWWFRFVIVHRTSRPSFRPRMTIQDATLSHLDRPIRAGGWIPVAIAYQDEPMDCQFLPINAGIAIIKPNRQKIYDLAKERILQVLQMPSEVTK